MLSFGCNHSGQLGRPTARGAADDAGSRSCPGLPPNIVAVAAGDGYSLALDANGDVWSWGRAGRRAATGFVAGAGATPCAGLPATSIAIAAGEGARAGACARDGAVLAWGSNATASSATAPRSIASPPTPTLLDVADHGDRRRRRDSLALRSDGTVLSWGINETGQLGSGSASPGYRPTPAPVAGLANVVAIACGAGASATAWRSIATAAVWAWGHNNAGQLGDGTTTARLAPVAVTGLNLN